MDDKFELWLGTFTKGTDNFKWSKIDSFDDRAKAKDAFHKYVVKQISKSEEETIKDFGSGRIDIELREGSKMINWIGSYIKDEEKSTKDAVDIEGEGIEPNLDKEYEDLVDVIIEQGDNPEVVAKAKERIKEIKEIKQSIKEG